MEAKVTTMDKYISSFPEDHQVILNKIRETIKKTIPDATETISYGIPTFKLNDKYVVYFAGYKHHVSVYPIPRSDASLQAEIEPFEAGKGTLQFPTTKPIPYELIERVTRALLQDNLKRTGEY
jgi:uncharacterized protein YdhG (YjbR/CyaY superfamily)